MGIADFTMLRAMSPTFRERQHMASMNELFAKHGLPQLRCRNVGDTYEWYVEDSICVPEEAQIDLRELTCDPLAEYQITTKKKTKALPRPVEQNKLPKRIGVRADRKGKFGARRQR